MILPVLGQALRGLRRAVLLLLAMVLTACTLTPRPQEGSDDIHAFSRTGRFALTITDESGRPQAVQGGFSWLDKNGRFVLDLTNPLGSTEARVEGRPGAASLTRADGRRLQASDPDALAAEAFGGPVPVIGMRNWLRGRAPGNPEPDDMVLDDQGRPTSFVHGEWRVKLSRYDTLGPQLLVMERIEPGRRIVLRIVINQP